jgi:hypothetical protein
MPTTLRKKSETTAFEALLAEAVQLERERRRLEDSRSYKLTPSAFVATAIAVARSSEERIRKLRKLLEEDAGRTFPACQGFLYRAVRWVREGHVTRPPVEVRRLGPLDPDGAATAELGTLNHTVPELFAVASMIAAERWPESFGESESWDRWMARLDEVRRRRGEVFAQLGRSWAAEDIVVGDVGDDGRARVAFRISNGEVSLAPTDSAGERLVGWAVEHGWG